MMTPFGVPFSDCPQLPRLHSSSPHRPACLSSSLVAVTVWAVAVTVWVHEVEVKREPRVPCVCCWGAGGVQEEEFVVVLPPGVVPHTRHVRGSNYNLVNVFPDRIPGRAIITSVVRLSSAISFFFVWDHLEC